jgi:aldose 1-epimerase
MTVEIWPELGGNCARWHHAAAGELLYAPPWHELVQRPTRGGIPVLFPFPNRIRAGHFHWAGRDYNLPKNDSTQTNAIHGFVCRSAWQVERLMSDASSAGVSLQVRGRACVDDVHSFWPADWILDMNWKLFAWGLEVRISVTNPDDRPLPMGFGLHPYLQTTPGGDHLTVPAAARWQLEAGLPTGAMQSVGNGFDLRSASNVASLTLDDVYTQIESGFERGGLRLLGSLVRGDGWTIEVMGSEQFREVVVFTPPHRQAVCIEPYTCPTDAVNLAAKNIDVGWLEVPTKSTWMASVSLQLTASA